MQKEKKDPTSLLLHHALRRVTLTVPTNELI